VIWDALTFVGALLAVIIGWGIAGWLVFWIADRVMPYKPPRCDREHSDNDPPFPPWETETEGDQQ
jgi:hypothetical protein